MKAVVHRLSKLQLKTFKISYSPTYNNFIFNHIATNPSHPLCVSQRRRKQEHQKQGLWWHATNSTDISKSACVRTWARRRLRQAFVEELKAKGYDETGRLVDATAMQDKRDVMNVVRLGRSVDLMGSIRIHGVGPLIPAKFETVKGEMRGIVETLVQSAVDTALGFAGEGERSSGLGQRSARAGALSQSHKAQERRPMIAPATSGASKKKPGPTIVDAAKELFRVKPQASPRAPPRATDTPDGPRKTGAASPPLRVKPQVVSPKAAFRTWRPSTGLKET